jgi:L-ascorbate metabolism protein UlaG (beta-lactamase superfamily)
MEIYPLGHASFKLRGKSVTVVTDPYDGSKVGIKFPKNVEADVVTVSHDHVDHNFVEGVGGTPFVIKGPGEYEIKGASVIGVRAFHDAENGATRGANTLYRIEIDGVRIVHLGDLGHTLSSAQVDALDGIDVLMIPVGGVYSLDAVKASEVIADLEPKIVIPMHYLRAGLNPEVFGQLGTLEAFFKQMGKEPVAPIAKLAVAKDKVPQEMQIVVLE